MSFNSDFESAFIQRSLKLVKDCQTPYDATLLLNCLLGLLLVPSESCLDSIPTDPIDDRRKWGISPDAIQNWGKYGRKSRCEYCGTLFKNDRATLRDLVRHLRNAVAHFRFKPVPERGEVTAFRFDDASGFRATVKLSELREFVERLAEKLKEM